MTNSTLFILIACVAAVLILPACLGGKKIPSVRAHELVESGAVLLDVRTPEEYAQGHLDGAVNIPVGELEGRTAEVGSKQETVVVYCKSGMRSRRASAILGEAGFTDVHDLGAMSRW